MAVQNAEDACLLAAWRDGTLTQAQFDQVANYITRWFWSQNRGLLNDDVISELLGRVVFRVENQVDSFLGKSKFINWIIGIAYYVLLEYYQEVKRDKSLQDKSAELLRQSECESDPEHEALCHMMLDDVLEHLADQERAVFQLWISEGLKPKDIGERLGISPNAAQLSRKRAFKRIRELSSARGWDITTIRPSISRSGLLEK